MNSLKSMEKLALLDGGRISNQEGGTYRGDERNECSSLGSRPAVALLTVYHKWINVTSTGR
jgi:hypothetical protein